MSYTLASISPAPIPSAPSFIVAILVPVESVIVIVVTFPFLEVDIVGLIPLSPFSPFSPFGPVGPVSPLSPCIPWSPVSPLGP